MRLDRMALRATLTQQITAAQTAASFAGVEVAYVKPHGALYNDMAVRPDLARDVVAIIADCGVGTVMGLPGSCVEEAAANEMMTFRAEVFADRAYTAGGTLVPRSVPGAVLHDPKMIAARVLRMAVEGVVEAVDGTLVPVRADSVCVHGDTPGAVQMARAVRTALTR